MFDGFFTKKEPEIQKHLRPFQKFNVCNESIIKVLAQ